MSGDAGARASDAELLAMCDRVISSRFHSGLQGVDADVIARALKLRLATGGVEGADLTDNYAAMCKLIIELRDKPKFQGAVVLGDTTWIIDMVTRDQIADLKKLADTAKSDLVRLARPPAPNGNGTTVEVQPVAQISPASPIPAPGRAVTREELDTIVRQQLYPGVTFSKCNNLVKALSQFTILHKAAAQGTCK